MRGVKLPSDLLKVTAPGPDVPVHCRVFSGGWTGVRWEHVRTAEIWVESVAPDCTLSVVYAYGGTSVTGSAPNFQRTQSRVVNGEAQIRTRGGSTIVLTAPGNRTLCAGLEEVNRGTFEGAFDAFNREFTADAGGYAFEQRRSGVTGSVAIRITNFWTPLPDNAPGATTISTLELEVLLRENPKAVLVDALYIMLRQLVRGSQLTDPLDTGVRKSIAGALLMADFGLAQLPAAEKSFAADAIARATS